MALGDHVRNTGSDRPLPGVSSMGGVTGYLEKPDITSESAPYNERMRNWARKHKNTDAIDVEMKAGAVVIWLGATWHAGGAYTAASGDPRRAARVSAAARGRQERAAAGGPGEGGAAVAAGLEAGARPSLAPVVQAGGGCRGSRTRNADRDRVFHCPPTGALLYAGIARVYGPWKTLLALAHQNQHPRLPTRKGTSLNWREGDISELL